MTRLFAVDLCCGTGGWADGLLAAGYRVIGFDLVWHPYPGDLVLMDVRRLDGRRLSGADLIVASPPCEEFSRWSMPWTRAKNPPPPDLSIWQAVERIRAESGVPTIIENVRGAQRFVGPATAVVGNRYLWGDVPALLPTIRTIRKEGLSSASRMRRAKIEFNLARWIAETMTRTTPAAEERG